MKWIWPWPTIRGSIETAGIEPMALVDSLMNRAEIYRRRGNLEKQAADEIRITQIPDASKEQIAAAFTNLGWIRYSRGNLDEALLDSWKGLDLDPHDATAAYNIALIFLRQGFFAQARTAYEAAMNIDLASAAGAVSVLVELHEKMAGPPETLVFLGWMRMNLGDDGEGLEDIKAYLKSNSSGQFAEWARVLLIPKG